MIFKISEITDERRREIERKQFSRPPDWAVNQFLTWEQELDGIDDKIPDVHGARDIRVDDIAAAVEDVTIKWRDLGCMMTGLKLYVFLSLNL